MLYWYGKFGRLQPSQPNEPKAPEVTEVLSKLVHHTGYNLPPNKFHRINLPDPCA